MTKSVTPFAFPLLINCKIKRIHKIWKMHLLKLLIKINKYQWNINLITDPSIKYKHSYTTYQCNPNSEFLPKISNFIKQSLELQLVEFSIYMYNQTCFFVCLCFVIIYIVIFIAFAWPICRIAYPFLKKY